MHNDPYDVSLQWIPAQQRVEIERGYQHVSGNAAWQGRAGKIYPRDIAERRLSKAEALARVSSLKKCIMVGSFVSFVGLSALVASQFSATASAGPSSQPVQSPAGPGVQDPSSSPAMPSDSDSGGFFNQQGGYGFGSGNSSSAPFSRSHAS